MMEWSEKDRSIFQYPSTDGETVLCADPLTVRRKLMARTGGRIDDLVEKSRLMYQASEAKAAGSTEEFHPGIFVEGSAAEEQIVEAVIYTFDLKPFNAADGTGASEKYCMRLFNWFDEWREKKNPSGETPPPSSPVTGSLPEHLRSHTMRSSDLPGTQAD